MTDPLLKRWVTSRAREDHGTKGKGWSPVETLEPRNPEILLVGLMDSGRVKERRRSEGPGEEIWKKFGQGQAIYRPPHL